MFYTIIETESNVNLTDLLSIADVPTFLFIQQEGELVMFYTIIETESNVDLTDLLGIAGVPTFLFIH